MLGRAGFWEILLIVVLILILFGHAKIPDLMRNLASGLKTFKKELKSDDRAEDKKAEEKKPDAAPTNVAVPVKRAVAKKAPVKKTATKKK